MLTLLIETSTERGLVALADPVLGILEQRELPFGLQSTSRLWPALQELVPDLSKIDLFIVGVGPGSYTGIRIGVSVAQGLAYALKKPLVGVCSLEGFIGEGSYLAVVDAKMSGAYIQERGKEPRICSLSELAALADEKVPLVTPVKEALNSRLAPLCPTKKLTWVERSPHGAALCACGWEAYNKGKASQEGRVDILYLRKTQAELERETHSL